MKKAINKLEKEIIKLPPSSITPEEKINIKIMKIIIIFQDIKDNIFRMNFRYMSIFNHIYHEVLDSKKENNNNYNNNLNSNSLFNNNNILTINEKIDYSMFLVYNDNVIKVVISIYAYCFIFEIDF